MKRRFARIGSSGAAITAVVGSALLSLLILVPRPAALLPGAAPAGLGHVDALLLPEPHVVHSLVHQLKSASAGAAAASSQANSHAQTPSHAPHRPATDAPKPSAAKQPAKTPAAASHAPSSEHHGKPDWAAHPHEGGLAAPTHPVHPVHPAHPAHPAQPAKGGKKKSAHG